MAIGAIYSIEYNKGKMIKYPLITFYVKEINNPWALVLMEKSAWNNESEAAD